MRPSKVIIDLAKLDRNIKNIKRMLKPDTQLMAIVKADAYGHGAVGVAHQALVSGASWLGVAIPEEGAELREAGITAPILVLGGIDETQVKTVVEYDLAQCVFSLEVARLLNHEAQRLNKKIAIHLKVDTGMGRIGLVDIKSIREFCSEVKSYSHLILEGIFTHFATADEEDKSFTNQQIKRFLNILDALRSDGINFKWIHAANSAAIIDCPDAHFNLVRAGIAMYGYYPSAAVKRSAIHLEPILQWETKVVHVKDIDKGDSVSYGRTFIAKGPMRIATLPVGYADGYSRLLSNRGWVLIRGQKAPIVGVVCMDQVMVDVTHIPGVKPGDIAVLIGTQGNETISAEDIARLCGTISYEVLTGIGRRIPRIYI
ncbi:MAG: alanine racemase [Caldicoprobacter sp.]|uniref:alanine racemase n=1 Tax=Caldicoprobacter sp. TaxID=2004500 RepID=UPI001DC7581F|nr:alanine racemase [Clostridia bacterium]